jgi:predicted HNH restriction endonuclease
VCSLHIPDGQVEPSSGFVPKRFSSRWDERGLLEGGLRDVVLSKAERDPAVRRAAPRHHGMACIADMLRAWRPRQFQC